MINLQGCLAVLGALLGAICGSIWGSRHGLFALLGFGFLGMIAGYIAGATVAELADLAGGLAARMIDRNRRMGLWFSVPLLLMIHALLIFVAIQSVRYFASLLRDG